MIFCIAVVATKACQMQFIFLVDKIVISYSFSRYVCLRLRRLEQRDQCLFLFVVTKEIENKYTLFKNKGNNKIIELRTI
jgi:hypothetical protein